MVVARSEKLTKDGRTKNVHVFKKNKKRNKLHHLYMYLYLCV